MSRAPVKTVAVVGLGYVGLPLAVALSRRFSVIGFDVSAGRIESLRRGDDHTGEVRRADLAACSVNFSTDPSGLREAEVIIIAVPTPVDAHHVPDLAPLRSACAVAGHAMKAGAVVVFESTVYPGVTEDLCVPLLEKASGLAYGRDFSVGYSPERINPGDRVHTLDSVVKIIAGSDAATTDLLAEVYGSVVKAGIHRAPSIRVAEAAKVIENTQRDINIALINELSILFHELDIDTREVLEAAGTKWNFLPFRPGLVGGHCIGVDPYYLTYKARETGYNPEMILAGRRINDGMAGYVAREAVKLLIRSDRRIKGARVGVLGLTFKENVPDLRNSKTAELVRELEDFGVVPLVHDPLADPREAKEEYGIELRGFGDLRNLDALILAVGHAAYADLTPEGMREMFAEPENVVVLDVPGLRNKDEMLARGYAYWRL